MDVNGSNMIKLFIKLLNIHIHTYTYVHYMYTIFIYIYIQVNFQFRIPSKIRPEAFLKGTLCTWLSGRERGVKPWVVTGPPPIGLLKVKACGVREFHDFRRDLTPKKHRTFFKWKLIFQACQGRSLHWRGKFKGIFLRGCNMDMINGMCS
jgi:hypothetical protein